MNNITEHIQNGRSVRTFDGRKLSKADIEKLASFAQTIDNPYKIPVDFKFMNAKELGIPLTLRELGATEDMLPKIAETSYEGGGYKYMTHEDILNVLKECF